jgi:hypothetical protein
MTDDWKILAEVNGTLTAELWRGLLEAQGIPVVLSQEGAGRAIGLTVGPLGSVTILVPANEVEHARQVLDESETGEYGESSSEDEETPQADT